MNAATTEQLRTYVADLIERLERFGLTLLPPNDQEEVVLSLDADGNLTIDLEARLPVPPRSRNVDLVIQEIWQVHRQETWVRVGYGYELLSHELDYRRALHRHDDGWFARHHDVLTHEHCESTMGHPTCDHYFGEPVPNGFDAFARLLDLWLTGSNPDCAILRCLGEPRTSR